MAEHYIGEKIYDHYEPEVAEWCNNHDAYLLKSADGERRIYTITAVDHTVTVQDYDNALEEHLLKERSERGYTTREPDYYINSSVPRWKQDALDWVAHRDSVMLYGLEVENKYIAGEPVPTLEEFKEALPKIQWTLEMI